MTPPNQVLYDAIDVVSDRGQTHGDCVDCFRRIAEFWTTYLGVEVSPTDVAQMMVLLKVARSKSGTPAHDHFVDQCGYSAIAGSLAGK